MKTDPLDALLAPTPREDPLDVLMRRQAQQRAAAALAVASQDPEIAAKANRHSRDLGIPASTVERNLPAIEREAAIRAAVREAQKSPYLSHWYADPRNAAAGVDDAVSLRKLAGLLADDPLTARLRQESAATARRAGQADGFFSRAGALLRSGVTSLSGNLDRVGAAFNEWSANNPLPWTSAEAIAENRRNAEMFRRRAGVQTAAASAPIRGQTRFADVKARPTPGRVLAFAAESGIQSLPGMAAAAFAAPVYVVSQAGGIGQARAENDGRTDATAGDVLTASPAAVASLLLERFGISGILGSTGKNVLTRTVKAAGREAATEALQSDIEYTGGALGTAKGWQAGEALDQMAAGAIGGLFMGGSMRGIQEGGGAVRRRVLSLRDQAQARQDGETMDAIMGAAAETKLRQRDPEALRLFLSGLTDDTLVENVYLPGDAVASYLQSGTDQDSAFWNDYAEAIAEAVASGGDVVIPTAEVAARLAGTPAWEALREDARFSPGGQSRREAGETSDADIEDLVGAIEQAMDSARTEAGPRDRVFNEMVGKLTNAGFTPDVARQYAALWTARAATRAERLGEALRGDEAQSLAVNRVLPEGLRPIAAVDNLDLVIQALRRGGANEVSRGGPTLLEWIAARGGIDDAGGDIASMGGDRWHKGKPGRRKLIRARKVKGQGTMLVGPDGSGERFGIDDTLQAAIEAGYFPELARVETNGQALTDVDKPDAQALLDAISDELRGTARRAEGPETDRLREMADELTQLLDEAGIDATTATDADIRTFVQRFQSAAAEGRSYEQDLIDQASPRRPASTLDEATRAVGEIVGGEFTNAATGIAAMLSRNSLRKMTSGSATRKSRTPQDHALAVANVDQLFQAALLNETRPDARSDAPRFIHRFIAPMIAADGEVVAVKITVKETEGAKSPNVLYTVEAIEVDETGDVKPAGLAPAETGIEQVPPQAADNRPTGFTDDVRAAIRAVKNAASRRSFNQFAGTRATNAPLDDLERARELEESGADADTIKSDTNWHRGDDGKWRWEIDDSGAVLRGDAERAGVGDVLPLSGLIDHKALFEAYPRLADLPVEVVDGAGGQYNGLRIEIGVRNLGEARRPNNEGLGVILHEVQHVIQMWERFASGGPSNPNGLRAAGFAEALDAEIARLRSEQPGDGSSPEGWASASGLEEDQIEATAARNVYRRIAGEVEARNSQARRDMSAEARRDAGERWTRDTTVADVLFPRRMFDQSYESGARGRITFGNEQRTVDLFAKADLSTFLHETGHDWLEQLKADAGRAVEGEGSKEARQLFADWETVKAWFAANGHAVGEDGSIPVEAHEMWARGVERFVMEGKAPSIGLRRAFEAFRSWLLNIYQVVQNLRAPIDGRIRDVMMRLVATDEEIGLALEDEAVRLSFDREQLGMSPAEYAALQRASVEARDEARDALLYRVMASVRARRTKEYQDQRAGVLDTVTEEVAARPVFKAMAMLRDGARIDRTWLIENYGADAPVLMPKAVPPVVAENGQSADSIAELAGFDTADAMIRALMGLEVRRREMRAAQDGRSVQAAVVEDEADAIMRDRYGDPLSDGTIEREAREIIHNDRSGEVIAAELRALERRRRGTGDPNQSVTAYQVAKRWAADKVREGKVADVASRSAISQYRRNARMAARRAEEAIIKGDVDEAFFQKRAQMLNTALVSEATAAADAVDEAVKRLSRVAKRRTMKNVDQDYLEQAQAMLEAVELRERSQVSLRRQGAFEAWVRAQEAEGREIVVPARFEAVIGTTHWSKLSVENLLGLDDAVAQIMSLGRMKQTMIDAQEEREFDAIVRDAVVAAEKLPQRPPSNLMTAGFADQLKHGLANADAALLKMETIFDWLDGGNSNGVFNRIAFRPIAAAQDRENAMLNDYMKRIADAFAAVPADVAKRWQDRVEVTEFINRETGEPWVLTRHELVAMALNTGNDGNLQRLTDGYGWPEQLVRDVLNRELSASEWQFVQNVWDIIDTLWPDIAAMERRVNGVEPDKVIAKAFQTPHGTFRGGYYPAVYDTAKSYRAEQFGGEAADLLDSKYTRATTRASSSKERSEKVKRPLLLQLGVINRHLGEVIHDVTHREALINAWRFLGEERVMKAVDQSLGPAIRQQFKPWLRHVANSWASERAGNEGIAKFLNGLRTNATVVGMGWRVSTIMTQAAGYSNSFEYVGMRWVAPEIARFAAQMTGSAGRFVTFQGVRMPAMMAFVRARSGEIANRMDTLDRDVLRSVNAMRGKTGIVSQAKRSMFVGIGLMDQAVVIPTWMGAYNKAIASGMEEADAIFAADKAVRVSQGASGAKDLAAVARGDGKWGEALKFFTMFYSYLSAFHQRQRTLGRDIASAVRERDYRMTPRLVARAWWLIVVPPLLAEMLAGRGPEEDEDWGWWAFRKMLFQSLGPIPFVRDIGEPLWSAAEGRPSFGYSMSPIQRVGETFVNLGRDIGKMARGEETKRATRDALESAGYVTGLVPGQAAVAAQFLVDVGEGEQNPETAAEWWEGLTKGKIKEDE